MANLIMDKEALLKCKHYHNPSQEEIKTDKGTQELEDIAAKEYKRLYGYNLKGMYIQDGQLKWDR